MSRELVREYLDLLSEVEEIEQAILECVKSEESNAKDLVSKQSRMLHLRVKLSEVLNKEEQRHTFLFGNRVALVERHENSWPTIKVFDLAEEMSLGDKKGDCSD